MRLMARDPASDPTDGVGIAFALASAVGFGLAIAVSRFAYEGGTNGFTVASIRSCVATLVVLALCLMTGRSMRVTRREWLHLTGLGIVISILFYVNVGAVEYISVGLTAFLFFCEWLTPVQLLGGTMVIAGILIMQRHDARAAAYPT